MTHLTEDELVLHYYGEAGPDVMAAERHLQACEQCARAYGALTRTLNAVKAPEDVDAPDDLAALRQMLSAHLREMSPALSRSIAGGETSAISLVWLASLLYPLALQALFASARWADGHVVGMALVALTLTVTCAGPYLAVVALNRVGAGRGQRTSDRLLVVGAVMATIGPALFLVVSRLNASSSVNPGLWSWYAVLALGSFVALIRWPDASYSLIGSSYLHRLSAVVLAVFVLAHVINQAVAFVSLPAYTAMRNVMRVASQHPAGYTLIVGAVVIQIATGTAMGLKNVRPGAIGRNLQAVSGWYLAAFLLVHVFTPLLPAPPQPGGAPAVDQFNLLATDRSAAQLPFLLLGVAAFLFHVGVYARLAALTYLAEASVRRLSYAGIAVAMTIVVTIGLSLCGVHLLR